MSPPRETEDGGLNSRLVRVETSQQFYKEQLDRLNKNFEKFQEDVSEALKEIKETIESEVKGLRDDVQKLNEEKISVKGWVVGALAVLSLIWPLISHRILKFLGW